MKTGTDHSGRPQARTEGLLAEPVGQDLVIYDEASQMAHSLAPDAALIWEHCDGRMSAAEIASTLQLPAQVVEQAVDEFRASGLLTDGDGYTRRQVGKRFAAVGGAALAAPLLYSAAVPGVALAKQGHCSTTGNNPYDGGVMGNTDVHPATCDATFMLFTAELTSISGAPTGGWQISMTNSQIQLPLVSTTKCSHSCPGGTQLITAPDSVVTGSTTAPSAGTLCAVTASGPFHVTAPVDAPNIFLTAVVVPASTGNCIQDGGPYNWLFSLTGPTGMSVQVRVASFAFKAPASALNLAPICPTTTQTSADFNFVAASSSQPVPLTPTNALLSKSTGGSGGSGDTGSTCLFVY